MSAEIVNGTTESTTESNTELLAAEFGESQCGLADDTERKDAIGRQIMAELLERYPRLAFYCVGSQNDTLSMVGFWHWELRSIMTTLNTICDSMVAKLGNDDLESEVECLLSLRQLLRHQFQDLEDIIGVQQKRENRLHERVEQVD
jgi:hypothetical protein